MKRFSFLIAFIMITILGISPQWLKSQNNFDIKKWEGGFRGFIDGRPATLTVTFRSTPIGLSGCVDQKTGKENNSWIDVVLRDTERGNLWRRCISKFSKDAPKDHRWENLELVNTATGKVENVGTYLLHTWDNDFISGWSTWNNKRYGRMFVRTSRRF